MNNKKTKSPKKRALRKSPFENPAPSRPSASAEPSNATMLPAANSSDTNTILAAIEDMKTKMDERFNTLETTLQATQTTLTEHGTRLTSVEDACSAHDARLTRLEQLTRKLTEANSSLQTKVTDLEARSRRQNVKVVGLAEKEEGNSPTEFFAEFIRNLLGPEHFRDDVEVDRCHRLGAPSNVTQPRPRILIAKLHSYRQKEKIMRLAQQQYPLTYKGKQIHIFPDLPAEIMRQRQLFAEVRKKLKDAGLRTGFQYPARLRVTRGTVTSTFNSPDDAERFADSIPASGDDPSATES